MHTGDIHGFLIMWKPWSMLYMLCFSLSCHMRADVAYLCSSLIIEGFLAEYRLEPLIQLLKSIAI